jgi:hypothetical protein
MRVYTHQFVQTLLNYSAARLLKYGGAVSFGGPTTKVTIKNCLFVESFATKVSPYS